MRGTVFVALIAACLTGCVDQAREGVPTAPGVAAAAVAGLEPATSEFPTHSSAANFWSQLSASERQSARQTFARVYAEAGETYAPAQIAVSATVLPKGAQAIVIRYPNPGSPPMLVFSDRDFNDLTLLSSIAVLSRDAEREPTPTTRRVLRLMRGGVVISETDGSTSRLNAQLSDIASASSKALVDRLTETAVSVTYADIPEIGPARLLRLN